MARRARSPEEKLKLIKELSEWFYNNTPSFSGSIGSYLAYLWPAIVKDSHIEVSKNSKFFKLLHVYDPEGKAEIWDYVELE